MYHKVYKNGEVIKTYGYATDWLDKLISFNGVNISYDAIGNPLNWRDNMSFVWEYGRRLAGVTKGTDNITYTYDADGLRSSKTVNNVTTEYYWLEGILHGQRTGNEYIIFLYDENGIAYGMLVNNNGTEQYYYYLFNAQGDVVGIMNSEGQTVAEYSYDAWGNVLSVTGTQATTIGQTNPIRYRGYYYDAETGFYLTGTRYYDPEIGRFISPDTTDVITATPMALTDKNLYAYCDNNPVVRADHSGEFWNYVIGGVVGAVVGGVSAAISGGDWKAIALGAGVGAVGGLLAASGVPAGFQIVAGGLLSGGNNLATQTLVEGKSLQEVDWIDVGIDTAIGAGTSALSYGVTRNASKAADKIICKGANKVVKGQQSLLSGSRYGKGAIKKGTAIMNSGIKQMNTVRGTSSVVGSTSGGFLTSVKSFFKRLFR